jgi:hypothetical protein
MSSAHEPSQLLEPSNLLEPLDLTERQLDFLSPSAGSGATGTSQRGFTRTTKSKFISRPARGDARSPLKAILMIAGAFACFGAGMAMPQLQKFTFDDVRSWQTIGTATSPSSTPVADAAVKPDASKLAESKLDVSTSSASNPNMAPNANGSAPPVVSPDRSAPDVGQSVPAGKDVVVGNQQLCPKDDSNCLDGAPVTRTVNPAAVTPSAEPAKPPGTARSVRQAASPQSADPERASPRASARQQERIQSSRHNRRAAQRNLPTVSRSNRRQDRDTNQASNWERATDGDVAAASPWGPWQERQADQASSRAWDRAADENVSAARPSGRRQGRDPDQASSWRRDRYDEYPRGDDRRVVDRAARGDDRMVGRARRDEGPLMAFPPVRYGW